MKMVNKRGQQMTLGTIIAIVLGIVVLVFLIFGFSTGWNNMWNKITELGGGSANVDDVVRGCEVACAQNSKNAYCDRIRTVNYADGKEEKGSCKDFETQGQGPGLSACSNINCGTRESTYELVNEGEDNTVTTTTTEEVTVAVDE